MPAIVFEGTKSFRLHNRPTVTSAFLNNSGLLLCRNCSNGQSHWTKEAGTPFSWLRRAFTIDSAKSCWSGLSEWSNQCVSRLEALSSDASSRSRAGSTKTSRNNRPRVNITDDISSSTFLSTAWVARAEHRQLTMLRDPRAETRALREGSQGSSLEKGTTSSWMTLARTLQLERGFFRGPRISSAN
jgi:hypothetical protein